MIEKFIQKTNTKEFYQDCDFKLENYSFSTSDNKLEMLFSINQADYTIPIEYEEWKLTCNNTEEFNGFFGEMLLPYIKLKILYEHTLLVKFREYNKPNIKMLIFGNEDVTPNEIYLNQPYIIAEEFIAERVK